MLTTDQQLAAIDGVPTAFSDEGTGRPVLLIHGAGPGCDTDIFWSPVLPALRQRYRTIAPDSPGYGRSDLLPGRDTPDNVARHFHHLLDHLGVETVSVVGHSRGGRVAVEVVAAAPERVDRLAVICSGSSAPGGHVADDGGYTPSAVAAAEFGSDGDASYERFAAMFRGWIATPERFPDEILRPAYDRFMANPQRLEEWVNRMKSDSYLDYYHKEDADRFEAKLRSLALPTMVLVGREDETSPWERYLPMVDMIPDVEFTILSNLGHFPQYERPSAFMSLLTGFLDRSPEPWDLPA